MKKAFVFSSSIATGESVLVTCSGQIVPERTGSKPAFSARAIAANSGVNAGTTIGDASTPKTATFSAVTGSSARLEFTAGAPYSPVIYEFGIYAQ